jgi:hypothetical protein
MDKLEFAELKSLLVSLHAKVDRLTGGSPQASKPVADVADDADLDGKYGNFAVRRDPNRWTGESMVGRTLSECPPDYLEQLAEFFTWKGNQDLKKGDEKKAAYQFRDAARCRGWADRIRASGQPAAPKPRPAPQPAGNPDADFEDPLVDSDIPF